MRLLQEVYPTWTISYDLDQPASWPGPVYLPYLAARKFGPGSAALCASTPHLLATIIDTSRSTGGWVDAAPIR